MIRKTLVTALALAATLAACEQGPSSPTRAGSLSILLTDAPGDFARAVVTIDRIYLQAGGDQEHGRIYLMESPATVNLLDLRNTAMALVSEQAVPGGTYSQLRMVISGAYIEIVEAEDAEGNPTRTRIYASSPQYAAEQGVTADGTLHMPSLAQSGLKINPPGGAVRVDGDQQILLLDFNVAESFGRQAGQSGRWVMHPVIHASDLQLSGSVGFSLALGDGVELPVVGGTQITLADFRATLDRNGDVLTESFVERNGIHRVTFHFLTPDASFPASLLTPAGVAVTLEPAFPEMVSVESGSTTRQAFTITSAGLE